MSYNSERLDRNPLLLDRMSTAVAELGEASDRVVASIASACRDMPRGEFLLRFAMIAEEAAESLRANWANDVALSLVQVRSWWY